MKQECGRFPKLDPHNRKRGHSITASSGSPTVMAAPCARPWWPSGIARGTRIGGTRSSPWRCGRRPGRRHPGRSRRSRSVRQQLDSGIRRDAGGPAITRITDRRFEEVKVEAFAAQNGTRVLTEYLNAPGRLILPPGRTGAAPLGGPFYSGAELTEPSAVMTNPEVAAG